LSDWISALNEDPTGWLLEEENPSVRYFTLRELLDRPESDSEVAASRADIMKIGPVPKILSKQEPGGYWGKPEDFYMRSKYKGTVWNLVTLAQLGADSGDERIKRACDFILNNSYDRGSGGFSVRLSKEEEGGEKSAIIPCLTGNMAWSLVRFGYYDNGRVQRTIGWLSQYMRFDDGETEAPQRWPYVRYDKCWGSHTCFMGIIKSLKALAEIPKIHSKGIDYTIDASVEYLLKHHIYKQSHDTSKIAMPEWLRFGFPYMWNSDLTEILGIMAKLGVKDDRMQEAIALVASRQDEHGRWKLETTFNGRMLVNIEHKDQPSKWVTLNALKVMKAYNK
jgi:hypothetical protein